MTFASDAQRRWFFANNDVSSATPSDISSAVDSLHERFRNGDGLSSQEYSLIRDRVESDSAAADAFEDSYKRAWRGKD